MVKTTSGYIITADKGFRLSHVVPSEKVHGEPQ